MKILKFYIILICSFSLLLGCTIQKRTVNKGYFVQWNFKLKAQKGTTGATKIDSKTIALEATDLSEQVDSSVLKVQEPPPFKAEELSVDKKDKIKTSQQKEPVQVEQTKLKKSSSLATKINHVLKTDDDVIKKAKMKKILLLFSIAFILSFTFGILWLFTLPVLWLRILNILFALLGVFGLIKYFKLNKELTSKTEKPKEEQKTKTSKYKSQRNLNIFSLAIFSILLILLTVAIILSGEFYWTILIVYLALLHIICSNITNIVNFQKLHLYEKRAQEDKILPLTENELNKKFKKSRRFIHLLFITLYLAFFAFIFVLLQM